MNKTNKMRKNGFTLLELLVVIGIIGILVSLITVSFSNAQKISRDSRRRQDLVSIQNAMEQYYAANDFEYPGCVSLVGECDKLTSPVNYMSGGLPTDPLTTQHYEFAGDTSYYTITATMEKGGPLSVSNLQ